MAIRPISLSKSKLELAKAKPRSPLHLSANRGAPLEHVPVEQRLSHKEVLKKQAQTAKAVVAIQVMGDKDEESGNFQLPHCPGSPLRSYLQEAGLMSLVGKRSFFDKKNLDKGRLRLYYEPGPGSVIIVASPDYSPFAHLQRSSFDAMKLALNMGGGSKVVSAPLRGDDPIKAR